MIRTLAIFVTLTATAMAAVAAWDRGGTMVDKTLLISMSVVIVLAVHLLPAISRKPAAWAVWFFCLLSATYGHLTFLVHSHERAGQLRSVESIQSLGIEHQIQLAEKALAEIKARPQAVVAADLSKEADRRVRAALNVELSEAKKASNLRDEILRLSSERSNAEITGQTDPVTQKLASVLSVTEQSILVAVGLTFAVLVELIGSLLWVEVLKGKEGVTAPSNVVPAAVTQSVTESSNASVTQVPDRQSNAVPAPVPHQSNDDVTQLKVAVELGKCKPTVAGIRAYFGCSTSKASELRRALDLHPLSA